MPRRSSKQTGIEIILIILAGIVVTFVALWNFLVETKLIWLVPVIVLGALALRWYLKKQADEKRALDEEKRTLLRKQAEEKRIENILAKADSEK
ncbi:hypothetical protein MNBD_CHLOROFLEXI01-2191 [hydrothermal vent metagenome]|uniref:Uncharacterized protein n=1 Tax=hydrothermal vent metagenome TaxID=652676 RepID=A0A3B0VIZ1_9ZZZZ